MINQLILEDLKGVCKCPKKFQLIDFGGAAFGIFFVLDSIRRIKKGQNGWAGAELIMGSIMTLLHSTKFFYSKELGIK